MRLLAIIVVSLAVVPGAAAGADQPKKSAPGTQAKRRPVRAAPVSPKVREAAASSVAAWLDQPGAIENPAGLVAFFEQLYRTERGETPGGPLRILHYGDSHTAADEWTGTVRYLLQAKFGDGGSGYSPAGRPFAGYRRLGVANYSSRGWRTAGLARASGDGLFGLGGVRIETARPGEKVAIETECERVELFYLYQPGGGSLEITENGTPLTRIDTNAELGPGYYAAAVPPCAHRFEAKTLARAPVKLFGWVTENNRGITYEALGINGAQVSVMTRWDEGLQASQLARRNPALVVLAYGTNEAGSKDWTEASYRDVLLALIARIRGAAPAASILVIGPPDRYYRARGKWNVYQNVDRIVAAQREAAAAARCAFWDLRERMGGKGSMRQWVFSGMAQNDHVHFTAAGYRLLGGALFKELMDQYQTFARVRAETLAGNTNGQTNEDR